MNFNNIIPNCVNQLINQYNNLQRDYVENNDSDIQIQRTEVRIDRLIMTVKIDRSLEKELLQVGFDENVSKRIFIKSQDSKNRSCIRFKIKNCGIDEYDVFVKSLLDRGIVTYVCGKNLSTAYDGPEPRSFIAQEDGETDACADGRNVHIYFKKGDVLIREIKTLNINNIYSHGIELKGFWKHYSVAQRINAHNRDTPELIPIGAMYPKILPI